MRNKMKNLINILLITIGIFILTGCGSSNNVTFTTKSGECANKTNTGPYCMGIVIQNNSGSTGGQNWINSTSFPISQVSYNITGESNIITPATNPAGSTNSMDPNNCAGSTIQPGGTCEFYVQLTGEQFGVESVEKVSITISYTVNDTLFGGSTNTANANITLYELTNLYMGQDNGYMNVYNNAWTNYGFVESSDVINAIAADNSSFGNVYLGGNNGVYPFGITSSSIAIGSISPSSYSGSNNLFTNGSSVYAALKSGTSYNMQQYAFSSESWTQTYGTATIAGSIVANANVYIPGNSVTYLANKISNSSTIYACSNGTTSSCQSEGNFNNKGVVSSLAYLGTSTESTTGVYAGTSTGLFYESGTTTPNTSATWNKIAGQSAIAAMASSILTNKVYIGDVEGKIFVVTDKLPTTPVLIGNVGSANISSMVYDSNGEIIYVATTSNQLYACDPARSGCTNTYTIQNSSTVTGMTIGSMLVDSLNRFYDYGSL